METTTKSGWRATPAPLLIAFAVWALFLIARIIVIKVADMDMLLARRLSLTGEGVYFACTILVLVGTNELADRFTGSERRKLVVASYAIWFVLLADIALGFLQFTKDPWEHENLYTAYEYGVIAAWLVYAVCFALVLPAKDRMLGWIAVGVVFISWLPPHLADKIWGALSSDRDVRWYVDSALRLLRIAILAHVATKVAVGTSSPQPLVAGDGLRLAARGLWIRVIAAVVVVMFTLMAIAGKGGEGSMSFFKLIMMTQAVVSVIALVMTGVGALRAARAGVSDLSPWTLAIGGGASLWAAGVSLAQVPTVYRMFYGDDGFSRREMTESMAALSVAMPVVVIVGVGLLATALSGYAARRGNESLRTEAQGKGIGFVVLLLVAIAVQTWMVPKSRSIGNFAMLSLLAAGASLWGTVMMAKLLSRGAEALEAEPGLPPASVVGGDLPPV